MVDNFSSHVVPHVDPVFARPAYVFFEVRNSSTSAIGYSVNEIIAQHQRLGELARQNGLFRVVCTAPPTDGDAAGAGVPGQVNAWIRANWRTIAERFVDLERAPEFTPAGNIANPTYYPSS
jgi:hypothetical protein